MTEIYLRTGRVEALDEPQQLLVRGMAALLQSAHTMWLTWERHDPGAEEKVVQPFAAQFFRRRDGAGATQDDVKFVQLLLRLRASPIEV